MGTYVVNVGDPTSPTDTQGAKQGAEELRALKALMAGFIVAGLAGSSVRQAIQSASLDATGYNNAITVGAGLRPGLSATATPYHLSYAAGFSNGKPLNFDEVIAADNADILGVNLPLSNTSYLHKLWNGAYGSTLIPPQYGYAFDRTKQALLNFEGINGAVTTTDDFGNIWTLTTGTITTAQFKYGTSAFSSLGGSARSVNFTTLGDGSWEFSIWFRIAALPGAESCILAASNAGNFGAQLNLNPAGKIVSYLSSTGTSWDIFNTNVGAATIVINQWHKLRFVYDALGGTYKCYVSLNGALETVDATIPSASRACAISGISIGANNSGAIPLTGFFDGFRFLSCATNTSVEVPAAVAPTVTDYLTSFFSIPAMKMFDITAASAVAGVNPTLTAVNRLFLGEADTSAVAVTAVRNYAVRGQYTSGDIAIPGLATRTAFSHNIGTIKIIADAFLRNYTAELGFTSGQITTFGGQVSAAYSHPIVPAIEDRNTVSTITGGNTTAITGVGRLTGIDSGLTPANWKQFVVIQRAF